MTLHAAIEKLLLQTGRPMTTQEIADELNKNKWYMKKDCSRIDAFQIHGRTKNYGEIFERNGSTVSLKTSRVKNIPATAGGVKRSNVHPDEPDPAAAKSSFAPIACDETTILILGTMPGDESIRRGEYYGHPRNRFWKIISTITGSPLPISYVDKKELLLKNRIGVWDVAHTAIRKGSLDSAIKNEEPNDLNGLIANLKHLKVIGFNGAKSEQLFNKYFERKPDIAYIPLPSTSPANAGIDFESICRKWKGILARLN